MNCTETGGCALCPIKLQRKINAVQFLPLFLSPVSETAKLTEQHNVFFIKLVLWTTALCAAQEME